MIPFTHNTSLSLVHELVITDLLKTIARSKGKSINKLFFHFVSEAKIQQVNNDHLAHDFVTDVITFDYSEGKEINAEAFVCPPEVFKNSKTYNQSSEKETVRVLLHALLHVLGYDDKSEENRKEMREQEDSFLAVFNQNHK